MVRRRSVALSAAGAALASVLLGCGGGADVDWADPQVLQLGGVERCGPLRLNLRRLELGRDRWTISGSFRNDTRAPIRIFRPHTDSGTYFGLVVFRTARRAEIEHRERDRSLHVQLVADAFEPQLPRLVAPGARWAGAFSGAGRLARHRYVRVVLGRFSLRDEAPPAGFLCVSDRSVRVP
jgi:hypothetical protein